MWRSYAFAGVQNAFRAELIAIRQALRDAAPKNTKPVVIFTDSLTALYNVIKYWERPHLLRHHHERPIIEEIVKLASRLGGGITGFFWTLSRTSTREFSGILHINRYYPTAQGNALGSMRQVTQCTEFCQICKCQNGRAVGNTPS